MTSRAGFFTWALLIGTLARPVVGVAQMDGLACFQVGDPSPKGTLRTVLGSDAGGGTCTVKQPARIACVSTQGGAASETTLCYRARCTPPRPAAADVTDASGRRTVRFHAARWVCLPATAAAPSATPTTTTTTVVAGACEFRDGECRGTCAPGSRCGAAVGTASCECRATPCGDADAPTCDGSCNAGEACVFLVVGCRCVNIP